MEQLEIFSDDAGEALAGLMQPEELQRLRDPAPEEERLAESAL